MQIFTKMNRYENEKLLTGLLADNHDEYFLQKFMGWIIQYSDEITVDGESLTGVKKEMYKLAGFKIKQKDNKIKKAKSIIASGRTEKGLNLTEVMFAEIEMKRVKNITDGLSMETDYVRKEYVLFLDKKLNIKKIKDITKEYWFIIGIKFATGEMDKVYKKNQNNATQTAKELGNKNYRPYISDTYGNSNKVSNKNLFSSRSKMIAIIDYCEENNLTVTPYFTSNLPSE